MGILVGDTKLHWLPRLLVAVLASLAAHTASAQQTPPLGRSSAAALAAEIRNAAPDQLYAVELGLSGPTSVGDVRAVSRQLKIPRVLAFVEFDYAGAEGRGLTILGLGEMYASTAAKEHSECQALLAVNFNGQSELRNAPIDDWPVDKLHVYATAHVIRELTAGALLPATILDGGTAQHEQLRKLEEYIRNEASQSITKPSTVALPGYCAKFIGAIDAPILAGELPPDIRPLDNETFRERAFRILAELSTDTAVTITLKVNFRANVEALAALVQEYEIRGMQAELVPERSSKRVLADAQLSTYGAEPKAQIHRVRCQMRIGGEQPQASSEWYADWISVSLSTEAAVRFLSHPGIAQAQIVGVYPLGELERLRGYHERLASRIYEMPKSIEIPGDCADVYIHNDRAEAGVIRAVPP